jgi:hypothetical protein
MHFDAKIYLQQNNVFSALSKLDFKYALSNNILIEIDIIAIEIET